MPTFGEIAVMIFAVGNFITAIGTILTYFQSRKNGVVLDVVREQADGINSALVESTERAAHASGEIKGRADEKQDQAIRDS